MWCPWGFSPSADAKILSRLTEARLMSICSLCHPSIALTIINEAIVLAINETRLADHQLKRCHGLKIYPMAYKDQKAWPWTPPASGGMTASCGHYERHISFKCSTCFVLVHDRTWRDGRTITRLYILTKACANNTNLFMYIQVYFPGRYSPNMEK